MSENIQTLKKSETVLKIRSIRIWRPSGVFDYLISHSAYLNLERNEAGVLIPAGSDSIVRLMHGDTFQTDFSSGYLHTNIVSVLDDGTPVFDPTVKGPKYHERKVPGDRPGRIKTLEVPGVYKVLDISTELVIKFGCATHFEETGKEVIAEITRNNKGTV